MLGLAIVFLLIAILAHCLGAGQAGDIAVTIAKVCFAIFWVLLVLRLVFSVSAPVPYWGWPAYRGV